MLGDGSTGGDRGLDEPTRGMDRDCKDDLAALLCGLDAAVLVATHDPEFVAAFAERVVLLADGSPIAEGRPGRSSPGAAISPPRPPGSRGAGGALTPSEGRRAGARSRGPRRRSRELAAGAFALLGLALVAGFAWYERQRPDARIVALVGTLAAFAALGRIAFAAVPNVKPTRTYVIAGYALGGGPASRSGRWRD